MPLSCGGNTVFLTNVRDIMIAVKKGVYESNMKRIKPEEMLMGAEVRTLALFVKYKLAEAERRKKSLGWELSCEFKTKEPADAPPHHIGKGMYIFRRGDVIYEYGCEEVQVQLRDVPQCYRDFPIIDKKGKKFLSASNRMIIENSAEEVCVPHFTRMVKGEKSWYRVGPGVRVAETPRQEMGFSPKHSDDEVGLYTEAEETDFDHLQGLAGYTDQVTKKVAQAVCQSDNTCVLKSLPGAPSYNLAYLEDSIEDLANLTPWEYFMKVAGTPMYTAYKDVGAAGGWITVIQWLVWIIRLLRKAWRACRGKGINQAHYDPEGLKAEALALSELMGPGAPTLEIKQSKKRKHLVRYIRGQNDDSDGAEYVQK